LSVGGVMLGLLDRVSMEVIRHAASLPLAKDPK
jgi:hypothetical protein